MQTSKHHVYGLILLCFGFFLLTSCSKTELENVKVSFNLPSHMGSTIDSKNLLGSKYILFFYPEDDTPG